MGSEMRRRRAWLAPLGLVAVCVAGGLSASAVAGGDSWKARVASIMRSDETTADLTVVFAQDFGGCYAARLHFAYEPEIYGLRTWSRSLVTKESHLAALGILQEVQRSGELIEICVMGMGLVPTGGGPCSFKSRGLQLTQHDGLPMMCAYHDPI